MDIKQVLLAADSRILYKDAEQEKSLILHREETKNGFRFCIENKGQEPVAVEEVVLFEGEHNFTDQAFQYGEGYQMLSQYEGTIGDLHCYAKYSDYNHYKLPQREGYNTVYNMTWIHDKGSYTLIGFNTCHRFTGAIHVNKDKLALTLNIEGIKVKPGEKMQLEEIMCLQGTELPPLMDIFVSSLTSNHKPLFRKNDIPTGWCSWYCYGPDIDEKIIQDNMHSIMDQELQMRYIQIDDGYQPKMGDWLEPNPDFGMNMKELCLDIKKKGFEPAVWVAPFIAEGTSRLFTEHPDWFVKDDEGQPLVSSSFTFGGWRCGPWYMLDGTHPEAQNYLTHVFKTMREEWKSHYFKLDANVWGALPGGHYYDSEATSVEAYRRGMEACLKGAGEDSFLLGCNAPMWPSLGTVHGMRVTNDISRTWKMIYQLYKEGMNRNWQHNRLWVNDPDCIVLENIEKKVIDAGGECVTSSTAIPTNEFDFHKAYILASGGMVLGSDPMMIMTEDSLKDLSKCLEYRGDAAVFTNKDLVYGMIQKEDEEIVLFFNPDAQEKAIQVKEEHQGAVVEFWKGDAVTLGDRIILEPHSAQVFINKKA